ncbi:MULTISPECIES: lipid-A-disaccharide synthase N-terminal domain-containing protein [Pseudomonas]|uniref:Lipid A biosynthesis, N-terminal n=1 Tax=Pseudomonas fluorescens TaxID=294 RepID=A0A159ZSS8_PSEFL|nr:MULTISPECIES: lipid-A-disaccharide synthase N-terminal domain-containing protein [Pseudomonas]AMZ70626.1 Lipid A biosynthesis, N-terminal [Pseudomonas fluorescens]SCW75599.1 Uncharacterized N-terminal domain of lipid-A-disaccharide synthase [Pseudomonas sp. NFACC05-1]SDB38455.1 Uncharacterized N-terminal domain of lipid-A-disaccharide synthase [Pseudomonas sp. NFACC17-2]SDX92727.1 Uncharacterized N-terminal domain of lipid-A-disaccharide synthase [Pseudomonas sp. NFACC08-1]SEJ56417.1 Unchar
MGRESLWLAVGFGGQLAFTGRFALQWLYSEYKKRSMIPVGFWYLSIVGSALLLAYAIYREDPVFIVGQSFGFIVYLRNLQLIAKHHEQENPELAKKG